MILVLMHLPRKSGELFEEWWKRRGKAARQLCSKIGFWSIEWAKRVVSWHEHVQRSSKHNSIICKLVNYHNNDWLLQKRSQWVASSGGSSSRVTALAGRTGTRLNIGQPQTRWDEGVALARSVLQSRDITIKGRQPLAIGSRIRNAISTMREFFDGHV